mmetsp:Transcript_1161/g.3227  ORF Transcript_1161/g.3227 Transcript_1161/m.3227 type:complete len:108 (-) Transcript_1161:364-687(-)
MPTAKHIPNHEAMGKSLREARPQINSNRKLWISRAPKQQLTANVCANLFSSTLNISLVVFAPANTNRRGVRGLHFSMLLSQRATISVPAVHVFFLALDFSFCWGRCA